MKPATCYGRESDKSFFISTYLIGYADRFIKPPSETKSGTQTSLRILLLRKKLTVIILNIPDTANISSQYIVFRSQLRRYVKKWDHIILYVHQPIFAILTDI